VKVDGRWRRTIQTDRGGTVIVLDQTKLPHEIVWKRLATVEDTAVAIRDMIVRGAPLIGVTAAYGIALAAAASQTNRTLPYLSRAHEMLAATRPTAVNLMWALREMSAATDADEALALANKLADDDVARCEAIGRHGVALIKDAHAKNPSRPVRILTHCNAGWLATVDWGTALAPVYRAHEDNIPVHVWVDETRPRNQGLLTAWELAQQGVPHTVIADNAGGHLMQRGEVDLCIVGTDRTTRTGDVCNKIGTYLKAVAAHDTGIPFYVAAPSPSIDWAISSGSEIPIEERSGDEVRNVGGHAVMSAETPVANPAFDVTPARLVTAIITERGIAAPDKLGTLFPERA
jgi:methylthioribose-1-phosphate isomerase